MSNREELFTRFDRQKEGMKSILKADIEQVRALSGPKPVGKKQVDMDFLVQEYVSKRDNPMAWMADIMGRQRKLINRPKGNQLAVLQVMLYAQEMEKELAKRLVEGK